MRKNPLKAAREDRRMTQARVAELCSIQPLAVVRAEQGLMSQPPRSILSLLDVKAEDYHEWVKDQRNANFAALVSGKAVGNAKLEDGTLVVSSVAGLAKAIVVQISMVQQYVHEGRGEVVPDILERWEVDEIRIEPQGK